MPVPPEVRRAFERRVDEILRQADRMTEEAVRRALELAEQTRREILDRLSSLPEGSFSARHLRGLREGLDRAIAGLVGRYQREVRDLLERAHELGIDLGEEPLKLAALASRSAGQVVPAGVVPRQTLEVLQDYSAELITRIGEEARARINSVLAQGALGVVSPHEAIRRIAGALPDASVFRSIGLRAETIYRTEAGRVLSAAAEVRMGQMADRLPRMRKQWVAVMDARTRPTHAAAHGQIVGAREQFVVGGYLARFPRDPYLPAGESISCRCWAIPVIDDDVIADLSAGRAGSGVSPAARAGLAAE
ncbi:MAG TPA: phage minor head protein [Actinomycetota bacterium]|nr:phage minor head protein [Actinomycetota bacterium]